jgi:hypothetical protein
MRFLGRVTLLTCSLQVQAVTSLLGDERRADAKIEAGLKGGTNNGLFQR